VKKIQLVIPAAGLGSRFASVGVNTPKPLIPVMGLPMIAWVIGNFKLLSSDRIIIITRPELEIEANLLPFIENLACQVDFVYVDHVTEGPAISVSLAKPLLDMEEALVVANSDQFVSADLDTFIREIRESESDGQILTMNAAGSKWSYVNRDKNAMVVEVKEKVEISTEATVGIYGWSHSKDFFMSLDLMMTANDRTNGEFYVAPSYNYLLLKKLRVSALNIGNVENHVHGLGTPEDLEVFTKNSELGTYLKSVHHNLQLGGR
jgi:dTDP-glucose pyrophosphorylase